MAQFFNINSENPQQRLINRVVNILLDGGVVVYPTDSAYALGCRIGDKVALNRIRAIRKLDSNHNFTLICKDFSELAFYARVNNPMYRFLKAHTPGPFTFIFKATKEVPRRLQHPKRKTIGLRIQKNKITDSMLEQLGESFISTTLIMPGELIPLSDPEEINEKLGKQVDLIIDGGPCGIEPTTVIDLTKEGPEVIREGKGNVSLQEQI